VDDLAKAAVERRRGRATGARCLAVAAATGVAALMLPGIVDAGAEETDDMIVFGLGVLLLLLATATGVAAAVAGLVLVLQQHGAEHELTFGEWSAAGAAIVLVLMTMTAGLSPRLLAPVAACLLLGELAAQTILRGGPSDVAGEVVRWWWRVRGVRPDPRAARRSRRAIAVVLAATAAALLLLAIG
jgi:lysylphosphatidylglycerol synthetase-like protein (DUF2156 family)